jgi:hypothetical protein
MINPREGDASTMRGGRRRLRRRGSPDHLARIRVDAELFLEAVFVPIWVLIVSMVPGW